MLTTNRRGPRTTGQSTRPLALLFLLALVAPACSGDEAETGGKTSSSGSGTASGGATSGTGGQGGAATSSGGATTTTTTGGSGGVIDPPCEGPLGPPQDPSTLPACCPDYGGAHCLTDVPPDLQAQTAACDGGGYCIPDDFIKTGGVFTPKSCTSLQGSAGVCLSACIPQVAMYVDLLPQDNCDADERCTPCVNPLNGMDTGACALGFECPMGTGGGGTGGGGTGGGAPCDNPATCVWDCVSPAINPAGLTPCPNSCGGHCLDSALVPPEEAGQLAACDASTLCVPDTFLVTAGKFVAPSCDSVGGFEGRCLSTCLPDVAAEAGDLPQSSCSAGEACVPCYDPFTGADTGACSLSCDTGPVDPPQTLPACCQGWGTCVPTESIPPEQLSSFGAAECPALNPDDLACVPDVFLAPGGYQPSFCTTSIWIQLFTGQTVGACLPECMPDVASAPFVEQDICPDYHLCIPCYDQNGDSTGACDPQPPP